jgi:hypothetical protein
MSREEQQFLVGFERAAQLTQRMIVSPPSYASPSDYLENVAHLHRDSDDLVSRGLVVGCLCALGKS